MDKKWTFLKEVLDPKYDKKFKHLDVLTEEHDVESRTCADCGHKHKAIRLRHKETGISLHFEYPSMKKCSAKKCYECVKVTYKPVVKRLCKIFIDTCKQCNTLHVKQRKVGKFCSGICRSAFNRESRKKSYNLKCGHCEKDFTSNVKTKFCSEKCRRKDGLVDKQLKSCKKCNKEFMGHNNTKYCSKECSPHVYTKKDFVSCLSCENQVIPPKRVCGTCKKERKEKNKKKSLLYKFTKVYIKSCPHCDKVFVTRNKFKLYCKPSHSPSSRESNRLGKRFRKNKVRRAKLSVESWNDINDFTKSRPKGCHLDHIIPLNHPDVCGLHNTWNFQWLSPEDNVYKSNKFDGTMDNNSWRDDED